mmetsp:Transcript_6467/g.24035  ORF Transcript_6467/g.24035 Transcript_6467/m.24035 type:complete len:287 (+) Transcript_6467:2838-3698(+)
MHSVELLASAHVAGEADGDAIAAIADGHRAQLTQRLLPGAARHGVQAQAHEVQTRAGAELHHQAAGVQVVEALHLRLVAVDLHGEGAPRAGGDVHQHVFMAELVTAHGARVVVHPRGVFEASRHLRLGREQVQLAGVAGAVVVIIVAAITLRWRRLRLAAATAALACDHLLVLELREGVHVGGVSLDHGNDVGTARVVDAPEAVVGAAVVEGHPVHAARRRAAALSGVVHELVRLGEELLALPGHPVRHPELREHHGHVEHVAVLVVGGDEVDVEVKPYGPRCVFT